MLTDLALRNLKPRATLYKVADRNGMYAAVLPTGSISFRYDYRINGRRETLIIGRYGFGGISLAAAREKLLDAKQLVRDGISPALQKRREKARDPETKTFSDHATQWLYGATMADSTRSMRKSVLDRDNGSTLKATTVLAMFHWLGVKPSYSRPRVSDDNAFVESLFKTAKYRPEFPAHGFANLEAARAWGHASKRLDSGNFLGLIGVYWL